MITNYRNINLMELEINIEYYLTLIMDVVIFNIIK